jgi:hypothetical protein
MKIHYASNDADGIYGNVFSAKVVLTVDELVSVVLFDHSAYGGAIAWREFPRMAKPASTALPVAMVTRRSFHYRLSDPLATTIAVEIFGKACVAKVPLMPDGELMGTLEFSLVIEPGQPTDYDLDPPLARGEAIDVCLRAPKPGTQAKPGAKGPKRPPNSIAAVAQYPRVKLPPGERGVVELLASAGKQSADLEEAGDHREGGSEAHWLAGKEQIHFYREAGYG